MEVIFLFSKSSIFGNRSLPMQMRCCDTLVRSRSTTWRGSKLLLSPHQCSKLNLLSDSYLQRSAENDITNYRSFENIRELNNKGMRRGTSCRPRRNSFYQSRTHP